MSARSCGRFPLAFLAYWQIDIGATLKVVIPSARLPGVDMAEP